MNEPYFTIWIAARRYGFTFWSGNGRQIMRSAVPYVNKANATCAAKAICRMFAEFPNMSVRDSISIGQAKKGVTYP